MFKWRKTADVPIEKEVFIWEAPNKPVRYPKWTPVLVEDDYFLILEKTKKKFISERAFWSWGYECVVGSKQSVSAFPLNGKLGFRSGSIIQATGQSQQYYIEDDKARLIGTPDFYDVLGFDPEAAIIVSIDELEYHTKGDDIRNVFSL